MVVNKMLIFANLPAYPSFLENVRFQTIGFVLVLLVLGLIALILYSFGYLFKKTGDRKTVTGAGTTLERSLILPQEEDTHELLAVIAAAVYLVIEDSHRIVSIRPVADGKVIENLYLQAWSIEGRRQHFASHKIR
ncbi:MAG: hypothetical protein UZ01_00329 [Candidatus Brocadia sinica]|nr:MAG: hypothetical protein UZ01_00329 [Candidatus Brocadia sinica]MCK6468883.1 OadG family protein [Candidatus Brocadia sinica]NUO06500.1 OadG family protein [Candidatus Brocadia sinica]